MRPRSLLLVPVSVLVACAPGGEDVRSGPAQGNVDREAAPEKCSNATVEYVHNYTTIDALIAGSNEVLIGKVVDERLGPLQGPSDDKSQRRTLTVSVERTLKGSPPSSIEIETFGWNESPSGVRTHGPDCPWFEVGDRALMALRGVQGERGASSGESLYRLADGQVQDTERPGVARKIESMSEDEVVHAVREHG
jgi:hypothetical protein